MAFSLRSTLSQAVLSTASVSTSFYPAYCFGLPSKAGFSIVCREEMAVAEVLTDKLGSVPFVLVASAAPGLFGKDGFGCFGSVTWNTGPIVSSSGGGFGSLLVAEYAAKKAAKGMLLPVASSAGGRLDFTSYGGFRFPRSLGHPITRGYCSSNGQRTGYCSSNGQRTPSGFPKDPTNAELAMAQFILKVRQETNQWFIEAKVRNTETLAALNMVKANKRAAISMARYTVGNVAYKLVLLLGAVTVIVHTPGNIPEGIKDWVANIFNSLASSSAPAVDPPSAPPAAPPVSAV